MPIALDKDGPIFRLVLDTDLKKPEAEQPFFLFRSLTGREWKQVAGLDDRIKTEKEALTGPIAIDMLFDALRVGLVGWGNMGMDYEPPRLDELLDFAEVRELIGKLLEACTLRPPEKKDSASPSPSSSDKSATDAPDESTATPASES